MLYRFTFCLWLFLMLIHSIQAQNNLSGQINRYTTVLQIDTCTNSIEVSDIGGFEIGSSAILIQMKGAEIVENENSENFGEITALNGAGLYEKVSIANIENGRIFLQNKLFNTYDIGGSVQLVTFPTFTNATIEGELSAQNWNGENGGVIAFSVTNTLTLAAAINADGAGFRGGRTASPESDCTGGLNSAFDYAYADGDWRGAAKGEGVADYIEGKENGRGAQANGGGGGNDHNAGGGGGANVNAGGNGGVRATPFIDLSLQCKGDNPGVRGKALATVTDRLFLGGGGGAGHTNNSENTSGGNGGGLIILEVGTLISNDQFITANGLAAEEARGDGASGGGAAGTIVLLVEEIVNVVVLEAEGGNGGNANNNESNTCMGPGGGGSGGHIITNIAEGVAPVFEGGAAGRSINSTNTSCQEVTNGAERGAEGTLNLLNALVESTETVGTPNILSQTSEVTICLGGSAILGIEVEGQSWNYQWQVEQNGTFVDVEEGNAFSGSQTDSLIILSATENLADQRFRVLVSDGCNEAVPSEPITIILGSQVAIPNFEFDLQTGGVVLFSSTSEFANSYLWDFGGGVLSTDENTSFTYPEEGEYEVTLTVENECGAESITQTVTVVFEPTADFTFNETDVCAPIAITFENQSSENTASFLWQFPGGTPATSTQENPTITYENMGNYDVILVVSNELGSDTLVRPEAVMIRAAPSPDFLSETANDGLTTSFTNTTVGGDRFIWDFGDGSPTSNEINPTHTYDLPGTYTVTLTATNDCGDDSISREVAAGSAPLANFTSTATSGCFPVTIQFFDQSSGGVDERMWTFPGGTPRTSNEENPRITYDSVGQYGVRLIVRNELGEDELVKDSLVTILDAPMPAFTAQIEEDGTVQFTNSSDNSTTYIWSFGDGNSSVEENPTHQYDRSGLYFATLNAYNEACAAAATEPINILLTSTKNIEEAVEMIVYPNPVQSTLNIVVEGLENQPVMLHFLDTKGRLLQQIPMDKNNMQVDISNFPSGQYVVQFVGKNWQISRQIVKN